MKAFGWTNPILVRRANSMVIAGHARLKAAIEEGLDKVPVVFLDMNETDADVYMVADNKLTENTEWDFPKLADLLVDFDQLNVNLDLTGFTPEEINDIAPATFEPQAEEDAVPEPPDDPITKKGDLWLLGTHRLLCGDATNEDDVKRLMDGQKADICLTDPPYSVGYASRKENPSATLQTYQDPKNAEELLLGFISIMPTTSLIMTYADKQLHPYVRSLDALGYETIDVLVWKKQNFCFHAGARYQQQHEMIFMARKKGAKFYSNTPANASTVIEVDRQMSNELHPTIRPMALWLELIKHHSKQRQTIYDPFVGSGTTIIAVEKAKLRICCAIEISPAFCDVCVKRWEDYTGSKAVLESK